MEEALQRMAQIIADIDPRFRRADHFTSAEERIAEELIKLKYLRKDAEGYIATNPEEYEQIWGA